MGDLSQRQAALAALRAEREAERDALRANAARADALDAELTALRRRAAGDRDLLPEVERLEAEAERRRAEIARAKGRLSGHDATIRDQVASDLFATPQTLVEQIDDRVPFLLLPVRLETRFWREGDGQELRVRIFPDDIAITTHDKALTAGEADAARAFWRERAAARVSPDETDRKNAEEGAWTTLLYRYGEGRAAYIARVLRPSNWDATPPPTAAELTFPDPGPAAPTSAGSVPRSFVMPDRFVVTTFADGRRIHEAVGLAIPDDLILGPDPAQLESELTRDADGRISVDAKLEWLFDFKAAVEVGLAVRIPLEPIWAERGFDRVVVLGLKLSDDADDGATRLGDLIEAHRFTRGLDLLPPGTPTNNSEDAKSGFSSDARAGIDELGEALDEAVAVAVTDHPAKSDAQRLAEGLGIDFDRIRSLGSAKRRDIGEALAMNRALWPATLGAFARIMVPSLVPDGMRESLERFALTYVTGRGLLPSLRAGRQPYGVLVTSVLDRWQWSERELGREQPFLERFGRGLDQLTRAWRGLARQAMRVRTNDPDFRAFMNVVGLQASSVSYASRKAVSDEHAWNALVYGGVRPLYLARWWDHVNALKRASLVRLGLDPDAADLKIRELTFLQEADVLDGPVIDADPQVPLSEVAPITPFDGVRNYIDWLVEASWKEIEEQRFRDHAGEALPAPKALLYRYLRHAYLTELRSGAIRFLQVRSALFAAVEPEPALLNIGATRTLTHGQLLSVDAAKIGASEMAQPVGDFLLDRTRRLALAPDDPPELLRLASLAEALRSLADLPTARLERLFAEHVDLCSYRLDAWHLGVFNRRLDHLRRDDDRARGIHLGAYGFVENLRPTRARRIAVDPARLPDELREPGTAVFERPDNGGYVHAPSLTHAVTAAVLRNAYLTHAAPDRPGAMSVNLSSARVREAMRLIEGMRNGQDLAALLGYRLERGLHEGHPGVELDEFIYVLRERFPLTSRKLTAVPDGKPAEVIEARNVVNGYDLLEFTRGKTYPFGLLGLPAPGSTQAQAIAAEIDGIADALDALSDLLMAEGVHQVVQGNYDRARGVLQGLGESEMPPIPEVAATPRSGRSLTQRLVVFASPGGGWTGDPPASVRAAANARLNRWLATILPAPGTIALRFTPGGQPDEFVALSETGLDALDVVLMTGETLGDGSSELERSLIDHYRATRAIADDVRVFFVAKDDPTVPDAQTLVVDPNLAPVGGVALAAILPLLRWLRALVSSGRSLHAGDLRLAGEAHLADPANPKGLDAAAGPRKDLQDLVDRANGAIAAVAAEIAALTTSLADPALGTAFEALEEDETTFQAAFWTPHLTALRDALRALARLGMPEALPASAHGTTVAAVRALVPQARVVVALAEARSAAATKLATPPPAGPPILDPAEAARARARAIEARAAALAAAIQALLGKGMVALPLFALGDDQRPEVIAAFATPVTSDALAIETWLQSLARVRGPVAALAWVASYREWLAGAKLGLLPVQLPLRAGDPWIGGAIGGAELPDEVLSVIAVNPPPDPGADLAGLMIDDWTELVPTDTETTGIAFHFDRPNAMPPQALLLAVSPTLKGSWRWADLIDTVTDTLERAKLRAVEPDHLQSSDYFQLLPATLLEFSSGHMLLSTVLAENARVLATQSLATPT